MLSIIISSYQPYYFSALEKNIAATVGTEYEIIKIDNPGKMGICEAYNKGANLAKYDNLLFLHEDILFKNQNWGQILVEKLSIPGTGVWGVAGSVYTAKTPGEWWLIGSNNRLNIIQHTNENENEKIIYTLETDNAKAKSIDGVFLACKKQVFSQYKFSETLNGFHGYDIDFSNRVTAKYQNYVTNKILIEHFSNGNDSLNWFKTLINIHEDMPLKGVNHYFEYLYFINLKRRLMQFKFTYSSTVFILLRNLQYSRLGSVYLLSAFKTVIKYILFRT